VPDTGRGRRWSHRAVGEGKDDASGKEPPGNAARARRGNCTSPAVSNKTIIAVSIVRKSTRVESWRESGFSPRPCRLTHVWDARSASYSLNPPGGARRGSVIGCSTVVRRGGAPGDLCGAPPGRARAGRPSVNGSTLADTPVGQRADARGGRAGPPGAPGAPGSPRLDSPPRGRPLPAGPPGRARARGAPRPGERACVSMAHASPVSFQRKGHLERGAARLATAAGLDYGKLFCVEDVGSGRALGG